jgi:hypothetical protein
VGGITEGHAVCVSGEKRLWLETVVRCIGGVEWIAAGDDDGNLIL